MPVHLGVLPTPAVAYLTVFYHADAGVMISASHNPYEYNGIKIFSSQGFKLSDDLEEEIEALVLSDEPLAVEKGAALGRLLEGLPASEYYIRHLASTVSELSDLHVLIDCANGAASTTAQRLFNRYNISAAIINDRPDGVNINRDCGSTHLEQLSQRVKNGYYDLGIAFDGERIAAWWWMKTEILWMAIRLWPSAQGICAGKTASRAMDLWRR